MISFILGLFFGKKMIKNSINNCILPKDSGTESGRNGTSIDRRIKANDDLG